jgi:hypothetical protein
MMEIKSMDKSYGDDGKCFVGMMKIIDGKLRMLIVLIEFSF